MKKPRYEDKNGKNGSESSLARLRRDKHLSTGTDALPDYATATPGWLAAAIIAVSKAGGAIQFGYSRDGGVYTIVILLDGDVEKNYVKQSEGIDTFLEGVYNDFNESTPAD